MESCKASHKDITARNTMGYRCVNIIRGFFIFYAIIMLCFLIFDLSVASGIFRIKAACRIT